MRDVVIGVAGGLNWDTLRYWANSVTRCGFQGERVIVLMSCDRATVREFMDLGFTVVGFEENAQGDYVHESHLAPHVERFIHIHDFLRRNGPFGWVITTDVRDVIFQSDPVSWLNQHCDDRDLVFSSEGVRYHEEQRDLQRGCHGRTPRCHAKPVFEPVLSCHKSSHQDM